MKILLIEDDQDLGNLLSGYLGFNDFEVTHASLGAEGLQLAKEHEYHLAIIDINLPDIDGFEVARTLKKIQANLPYLFLTARNKKGDIIQGLKIGADDYITKPFEPEELVLRIHVILKRHMDPAAETLHFGKSALKPAEFLFCTPLKKHKITPRETELLTFIIQRKNQLIKREFILQTIWGENDFFLGRSMDVFISRFRKMLLDDPSVHIETIRGVGYIFRETDASADS